MADTAETDQATIEWHQKRIADLQEAQRQLELMGRKGAADNLNSEIDAAQDKINGAKQRIDARKAGEADTGFRPVDYGGRPGAAEEDAEYYRNLAEKLRDRGAPVTDYTLAEEDRAQQLEALGLMRGAAMGEAPSVAAIQQQQGLNQAMGMAQSQAASARGGGPAQALAARTAISESGDIMQRGVADAAMLRAQEMAEARGAYGQMGMSMGAQSINKAQYLSDLAQRAREGDDKAAEALEKYRISVRLGQAGIKGDEQNRILTGFMGSEGTDAATEASNVGEVRTVGARKRERTAQGISAAAPPLMSYFDADSGVNPVVQQNADRARARDPYYRK